MKNIVLVGLEGTNKAEIGKDLANRLKMKFIDTDDIMKKESGLDLSELLKKVGEKHFRSLENSIIEKISNVFGAVIVAGGGSILNRKNIKVLKQNGLVVNLITSKLNLKRGKFEDEKSHLLGQWNQVFQSAKGILNLKTPSFPAADYIIDVTDLSIEEASQKIIEIYGRGRD
ncbi:MAG: shikimate kinase [Candidatus Caldatribacteriota bacterium]|nr:shikimate kinase [Candidatus Caldatribacteriota bacterium]